MISVLGYRWGNELQLEVLILKDAVEGWSALGATEGPVALAAAILGEFCKESQLQRRGYTSGKRICAGAGGGGNRGGGEPEFPALATQAALLCGKSKKKWLGPQGWNSQASHVTLGKISSLPNGDLRPPKMK